MMRCLAELTKTTLEKIIHDVSERQEMHWKEIQGMGNLHNGDLKALGAQVLEQQNQLDRHANQLKEVCVRLYNNFSDSLVWPSSERRSLASRSPQR